MSQGRESDVLHYRVYQRPISVELHDMASGGTLVIVKRSRIDARSKVRQNTGKAGSTGADYSTPTGRDESK